MKFRLFALYFCFSKFLTKHIEIKCIFIEEFFENQMEIKGRIKLTLNDRIVSGFLSHLKDDTFQKTDLAKIPSKNNIRLKNEGIVLNQTFKQNCRRISKRRAVHLERKSRSLGNSMSTASSFSVSTQPLCSAFSKSREDSNF